MSNIKAFEDKRIRTEWNAEEEDWYFSIVDVVEILTDSKDFQTAPVEIARPRWQVKRDRCFKHKRHFKISSINSEQKSRTI